jgi:hypothetical protein
MTEKVYITNQQMATFVCPECSRSKTVNVSEYTNLDKLIKVKVKCPCGHAYTAILEKRKQYRKKTNLPGTFIHFVDGRPVNRGVMNVEDISATGLKLRLNSTLNCTVGDYLDVEFNLDDRNRALIKSVAFGPAEALDKALGFYLFS